MDSLGNLKENLKSYRKLKSYYTGHLKNISDLIIFNTSNSYDRCMLVKERDQIESDLYKVNTIIKNINAKIAKGENSKWV